MNTTAINTARVCLLKFGASPFSGNIYTREGIEKAVSDYLEVIKAEKAFGEFRFPEVPADISEEDFAALQDGIAEERVCLKVDHIWVEDDGVHGHIAFTGPKAELFEEAFAKGEYRFALRSWVDRRHHGLVNVAQIIAFDVSTNLNVEDCPLSPTFTVRPTTKEQA